MQTTFKENCRIENVMNNVAAGQAATTGDALDTQGFDRVVFICNTGAIEESGTMTMVIHQSDASDSGFTVLDGPSVAQDSDDDNTLMCIEIYRPEKRYLKAVVTSAEANGTKNGVIALLLEPKTLPITESADVIEYDYYVNPGE